MYRPEWMRDWIVIAYSLGIDEYGQPQGFSYTSVKGRIVYGDKSLYSDSVGVFFTSARSEAYLDNRAVKEWLEQQGISLIQVRKFAESATNLGSGTASSLDDLPVVNEEFFDVVVRQQKKSLFGGSNRAYIYLAETGTN